MTPRATVLVVDDDPLIRWSLVARLKDEGYLTLEAGSVVDALARHHQGADVVLLDVGLPDGSGLTVLTRIREADPDTRVIMLTAQTGIDTAVEAMKQGAFHYATKPFNVDEVVLLVASAVETIDLRREVRTLRARQAQPYAPDQLVGHSPAAVAVRALLQRIATSPASTVLLTGESGTGKDLAAKIVHYNSSRAARPFMNITCSALPDTLLESELFGHERGAFTGADRQKKGLLESADGGTVFLDEIGEMAPMLQAKMLRFLEEKTFKRVGGAADIKVDVRVIAATNRTLEDEVKAGRFREDLYYRLHVMAVALPPLRERPGDVPLLLEHYIAIFNAEFRKKVRGVTLGARTALEHYPWPGNVREIRNAVERAMLLSDDAELDESHFAMLRGNAPTLSADVALPASGLNLETLERSLVVQALERSSWNQTKAAALLGLNRDQIRYRIDKFGLEKPS